MQTLFFALWGGTKEGEFYNLNLGTGFFWGNTSTFGSWIWILSQVDWRMLKSTASLVQDTRAQRNHHVSIWTYKGTEVKVGDLLIEQEEYEVAKEVLEDIAAQDEERWGLCKRNSGNLSATTWNREYNIRQGSRNVPEGRGVIELVCSQSDSLFRSDECRKRVKLDTNRDSDLERMPSACDGVTVGTRRYSDEQIQEIQDCPQGSLLWYV